MRSRASTEHQMYRKILEEVSDVPSRKRIQANRSSTLHLFQLELSSEVRPRPSVEEFLVRHFIFVTFTGRNAILPYWESEKEGSMLLFRTLGRAADVGKEHPYWDFWPSQRRGLQAVAIWAALTEYYLFINCLPNFFWRNVVQGHGHERDTVQKNKLWRSARIFGFMDLESGRHGCNGLSLPMSRATQVAD